MHHKRERTVIEVKRRGKKRKKHKQVNKWTSSDCNTNYRLMVTVILEERGERREESGKRRDCKRRENE